MGKVTRFASLALAAGFALSIIAGTAGAAQAQGNSWFGHNQGKWAQSAANWAGRRSNWANNGGLSGIANGIGGGGCHHNGNWGNNSWGNNGGWGNRTMGNAMGQWHKHHHHHHNNWMNGANGYTGYNNGYGTTPGTGVAGFIPNPNYGNPYGNGAYGNPYGNGFLPTGGTGSVIGNLLNGLTPNQAQQLGGYGY